jgi:1-acyl-sn-glycerol-3-phosphate acyltransferase
VCIFPEGRLTLDGELNPFRRGFTEILARSPVPVIPIALRGLWGSVFSRHADGRSRQRGLMSRLTLAVGEPRDPATVTPESLYQDVATLRGPMR